MRDSDVVQIVITRRGGDTFRIATFTEGECNESRSMDGEGTRKFVQKTMKQLKALPGLDSL